MRGHDLFRVLAVVALVACYVTILIGGNVMASDSGLACPDWPTCHGSLTPPIIGPTAVEWSHRLSAVVLSVLVLALFVAALLFERSRPVLRRLGALALATVVGQALLGGLVVESGLSVAVVLSHLALATALFAILLVIALIANLRELPRRWIDWAWDAAREQPILAEEDRVAPAPVSDGVHREPEPTS